LFELIRTHQWKKLFWSQRAEVQQQIRFFVFGHALHEKAMQPYKAITARTLLLLVNASFPDLHALLQRENIDQTAAEQVRMPASLNSTLNFPPLPIMGIPGWADNGSSGFYDDAAIFR
jgi:hypothetical protein